MNKYELQRKLNYFLAKQFGIASDRKTYIIAKEVYEYDREIDDDRWIIWEKVRGIQLYPFNKSWLHKVDINFGECSLYRSYIREHLTSK